MRKLASLQRFVGRRQPKVRFTIFTEGQNTEPEYFRALKRRYAGAILDISILSAVGVPLTIARKAKDFAIGNARRNRGHRSLPRGDRSFAEKDQIWAVFDRDDHPHIDDAQAICHQSGIRVAMSNPCFELWLILHILDYDRAGDRKDVQRALTKTDCGYDHNDGKRPNCDSLIDRVEVAENRAETQFKKRVAEGNPLRPPYTQVYQLTAEIRSASLKHAKK